MTTKMTDTAAEAAIGAASRELHLPTVRAEAERLAETAEAVRASHLGLSGRRAGRRDRRPGRAAAAAAYPARHASPV